MTTPFEVSMIVPARNEFYHDLDLLSHTVNNLLENTTETCEVIVILDGYDAGWPPEPLPTNPRITVVQHAKSIGQRAACNEGVRLSKAKYICKIDAHCAVDKDFDVKMARHCDYLTTLIGVQYNLHAFSWKCKQCSHETYQGPKPVKCVKCGSRYTKIVAKWQPRGWKERNGVWEGRPKTTAWYFDTNLHFQYAGEMQARWSKDQILTPTMTCLGACWMLQRERYWELDGMDELAGSWGQQGVELAMKTWLSGGQMLVNHETWFAHLFRTQAGFGFPYSNPGADKARARSRELWLGNKWSKQVRPLSWLIEQFRPVRDWHTVDNHPMLAKVNTAGASFRSVAPLPSVVTGSTVPPLDTPLSVDFLSPAEKVSPNTVSLTAIDNRDSPRTSTNVLPIVADQLDMERVAAGFVVTDDMVQDRNTTSDPSADRLNEPSVHVPMGQFDISTIPVGDVAIPFFVTGADPNPAIQRSSADDTRKDTGELFESGSLDNQDSLSHGLIITQRAGLLYYTCNTHDLVLEQAARNNLLRGKNGHELGCVSRERTDFGDWNVVVCLPRSGTTMHYQILRGLERMRADYVFLCESDMLYHVSHFDFTPPDPGVFYYNTNVWRVRYSDGHAVRTDNLQQVSGICANRELLLAHYKKRIAVIESNGGTFDVKHMAYEPGTRGRFGDEKIATWQSPYPNLDITGHGQTLTRPKFSVDEFRNKRYAEGWRETDEPLPGWPKVAGRLSEWLKELADGTT